MSYVQILEKVYSDLEVKCPEEIRIASKDNLHKSNKVLFKHLGDLLNKLNSQNVGVKKLLDAYLFGNNNLYNWTKNNKYPKISIQRNLYTYIGLSTFLKLAGEDKYSFISEFDRQLMLFTNVRNIASFIKYAEDSELYGKAKTIYALNQIIRETLVYKHKTSFSNKFFKYLASINHDDMSSDDINLLIGLHHPVEHETIREFLKEANGTFFVENLPLAQKLKTIRDSDKLDGTKYKFLYELVNISVKDFEKNIGNFLKHRGDIYGYEEKEFQVSALALGYLEIKPDVKLISDLMRCNHSDKLKRAITNLMNAFYVPHLCEKSPVVDGYVKSDSYNDFKTNIDKCSSMLDLVELLEKNINHILTMDEEFLFDKIHRALNYICQIHLKMRVYFDDDILKNLERMTKDNKLWGILIHLITNSEYLDNNFVEEILKILEEKGSQRARLCLFNGYMNGAYGIKKNSSKADSILKRMK